MTHHSVAGGLLVVDQGVRATPLRHLHRGDGVPVGVGPGDGGDALGGPRATKRIHRVRATTVVSLLLWTCPPETHTDHEETQQYRVATHTFRTMLRRGRSC